MKILLKAGDHIHATRRGRRITIYNGPNWSRAALVAVRSFVSRISIFGGSSHRSVAIMLGLVGAVHRDTEVGGLTGARRQSQSRMFIAVGGRILDGVGGGRRQGGLRWRPWRGGFVILFPL